ncbi:LCP family protein [Patulibacter sp. NPDC049589]|uniref:LCP family protein n=1 Tax=Patulibacter sp. NPDC049589 TaxID=3154731 RepID=UPI00342EB30E
MSGTARTGAHPTDRIPGDGRPRRVRPRRGIVRPALLALLLTATGSLAVTGCGDSPSSPVQNETPKVPKAPLPAVDIPKPGRARTVLLAGLDHRYADGPGAKSRSDTMLLVRLDPDSAATSMLSLPRDLRVASLGRPGQDKLNSAWFRGGQNALKRVLGTELLGTPEDPFVIDDVVSVRFDAFSKIVNTLGCLYADVDRKYFVAPNAGHAQIDQPAGYQRLCGEDALAYVRYRIGDSDFVREARQANYLTEVRTQIDPLKVLSGGLLPRLAKNLGKSVSTREQLADIAQLAVYVVGRPTSRIELEDVKDATDGSGDVLTTPAALERARRRFLAPRLPSQKTQVEERTGRSAVLPERGTRLRTSPPATLTTDTAGAKAAAKAVRRKARGLRVYVPDLRPASAVYDAGSTRGYRISGPNGKPRWPAYRVVARTAAGQYYGVEGTTWTSPPVLDLASDVVRIGGRTWSVQYVGRRVHRLIWRDPDGGGVYWLTNTLTDGLKAQEMYAIAKSLERR